MLKSYLKNLYEISSRGDAREESFYSALEGLLKDYSQDQGKKNVQITTLPKKTEAGNPDFRVWDGKQHIVGYIEAKDPKTEFLDQIETSEQLKRYRGTFPNLLLTNFFEFRLYRNGELIDRVQIGRPAILHKVKTVPPVENEEHFLNLLERYFSFSLPRVYDARSLAVELAKRTRFLKEEVVSEELKEETSGKKGFILGFYEAFRKYLISGLSHEEFADLYSQTVTYGLFAARTRAEGEFNRKLAYDNIPHTIGILRDVFKFVSLGDLPKQMEWIIDDISEVLAVTDVKKLLHRYFHEGKGKDPIIHFYETFLAEYDPKTRERRGVYYTPEPVVSYIVRSVHKILKEEFDRKDGLASETVTVLDPAAGTLTFLAEAASLAVNEFADKYGRKGKEGFIRDHILNNFYAFELMMAPYAIGHIKMSFLLEELGYRLAEDERCKLYLTNTLEMEELEQTELPGMASLSEESHLAGHVKKKQPILVIIGNPPYSVSSANKSDFIDKEMELYKKDVREEKNIQPLSDDYIKFLRFAHWKVDKAGEGIIGMITNNSYLSGLIHRGMRKTLLESFNEIYIVNLHGNSRLGEKCPDGSKDENVFDIMQGVSIAIFVKSCKQKGPGKVFYQDVYGLRKNKYDYLENNDLRSTEWKELQPHEPYYFFEKKDFAEQDKYNSFLAISDIFDVFSEGVKTHRDHFVVGFTKEEIVNRLRLFKGTLQDEFVRDALKLNDTRDWSLSEARKKVSARRPEEEIRDYAYRPFDVRKICFESALIEFNRMDVMQNVLDRDNIGLNLTRRLRDPEWRHIFCTSAVTDKTLLSSRDNCYFFPLYIYAQKEKRKKGSFGTLMLFEPQAEYAVKRPNLSPAILERLEKAYGKRPTPEQVFYYIYAVLYSETYRTKYAEFLKIDFPRIPFTKDYALFSSMAALGKRLADLHLMKSPDLDTPIARFEGEGEDRVEKPLYDADERRVYINKTVYFEGVPPEIWEYRIGGYQVCDKWLKDRKGRKLEGEFKHYLRIITAIQKTIETQKEIDGVYGDLEKEAVIVKG